VVPNLGPKADNKIIIKTFRGPPAVAVGGPPVRQVSGEQVTVTKGSPKKKLCEERLRSYLSPSGRPAGLLDLPHHSRH